MAMDKIDLQTPAGRMVQGHPLEGQTTDMENRPLTFQDGTPRQNFFFALAVEKSNPEWAAFWAAIHAKAGLDFPAGQTQQADFSWKVSDGDAPINANKVGFPGHYVIKMSSSFAPKLYDTSSPVREIVDPNQLKRGDYVRVQVKVCVAGSKPAPVGILVAE